VGRRGPGPWATAYCRAKANGDGPVPCLFMIADMDFDRFTMALLVLRDHAPDLTQEEEDALQDAHMAHLADLHAAGHLLAAEATGGASPADSPTASPAVASDPSPDASE
jgi:uncharacterized protein YciI